MYVYVFYCYLVYLFVYGFLKPLSEARALAHSSIYAKDRHVQKHPYLSQTLNPKPLAKLCGKSCRHGDKFS